MMKKQVQFTPSPYDIFRSAGIPHAHGCSHIMHIKGASANVIPGTPAAAAAMQMGAELLESYRVIVRYALASANRHHLDNTHNTSGNSNSGSSSGHPLLELDNSLSTGVNIVGKNNNSTIQIHKVPVPKCSTCDECVGGLHVCLHCVFIGCWKDGHIQKHMKEKGHSLCMDVQRLSVYCRDCKDYVYDNDFEYILRTEKENLDVMINKVKGHHAKRKSAINWIPTPSEIGILRSQAQLLPCAGLKGLWNMGSTCFMNAILQCCIHNPLMRAHFLGDKHNHELCKRLACLGCETDKLFTSVFSGGTEPYGPSSFLHAMWVSESHMAGYSQQDAHEFFIGYLNAVHESEKQETSSQRAGPCKCIIHRVFSGILQSEVTCSKCGNVTQTYDPMLDISLDVRKAAHKKSGNVKAESSAISEKTCTIYECFDKFTHSEKLEGGYTCSSCGQEGATKQMSLKSIPPVLAIQLKRFEHSQSSSYKIDANVDIYEDIDLSPYTSQFVKMKDSGMYDPVRNSIPTNHYRLFAVVNHTGNLETGHYTAHAKSRNVWYRFDDHKIETAGSKNVLQGNQAYMLFYIKKHPEPF